MVGPEVGIPRAGGRRGQHPAGRNSTPPPPYTAEAQAPGLREAVGQGKRRGTAADQQWEEARHRARLREVADNDFVSEDDDEELPGEWGLEPFEPP